MSRDQRSFDEVSFSRFESIRNDKTEHRKLIIGSLTNRINELYLKKKKDWLSSATFDANRRWIHKEKCQNSQHHRKDLGIIQYLTLMKINISTLKQIQTEIAIIINSALIGRREKLRITRSSKLHKVHIHFAEYLEAQVRTEARWGGGTTCPVAPADRSVPTRACDVTNVYMR